MKRFLVAWAVACLVFGWMAHIAYAQNELKIEGQGRIGVFHFTK